MEQVIPDLDHMSSVSFTAVATEIAIFPASVCRILTNSLGKQSFYKVDSTCAHQWPQSHVCSCYHPSGAWKKEGSAFIDHILTVDGSWMHSFDPQLKRHC
jgi:hypothetical protein